MTLLPIASQIIGGVVGNALASGDRAQAAQLMKEAYDELINLGYPPDLSEKIAFEELKQTGVMTPEMEKDFLLAKSKLSQFQEDPALKGAQMGALESLIKSGKGGFTQADRAAYEKMRSDVARDTEAQRQQILQAAQARGIADGGSVIASQLMAGQEGANRASQQGLQQSGQASQNALAAMAKAGDLGGSIRTQDFNIAKSISDDESAIDKFNIQQQSGVEQRNIAARNLAQQKNLGEQQRIADYNTQLRNAELARQQEARRQNYLDKVQLAKLKSEAKNKRADQYTAAGDATAGQITGIANAVGGGIASYGQSQRQDDFLKRLLEKKA